MQTRHSLQGTLLRGLACALCLQVVMAPSYGMSIRELRGLQKSDAKQGANYMRYYLVGAMESALEVHNQMVRSGAAATICPNNRRLTPDMAESLYKTELQRNSELYEADMPVPLVMANALATVYPC